MSHERVLLVDPEIQRQRRLRAQLQAMGFEVRVADRGEDALTLAAEFEPEVILLSAELPGMTGVETCRRLREWTPAILIVLNGEDHEHLSVDALNIGADDFMCRPFSMAELLARMRAILRRVRETLALRTVMTTLVYRNLTMDLVNRRVILDERPLHLTPTEYELLRVLATHAGQVLTHRELLTRVWGPESMGDTQYLHVFIPQLRRKLEPRADSPRHILTEPGVGYCFSAEPMAGG